MISVRNVRKVFESKFSRVTAVDQVNLEINEGEIFGIIGYSGAGKSTLIRMFNGLELPTSGSLLINGQDLTKLRGKELRLARQKIGMIFQHFNLLWSRTVQKNIEFPLEIAKVPKEEREKKAKELIRLVGLEGKENAYPSELSGGQKQRVGIARALANDPKVLLCDEATSALDPETTDSILDLLVDINQKLGLTIILITHEMHVIRKICHRVAVMEEGRIVEIGDVIEVFQNPKENITKRFVGQLTESENTNDIIEELIKKYQQGMIVKLTFIGETAEEPIITQLIRKFPVSVNILQGNISQTQNGNYGTLYVHLDGEMTDFDSVFQFLNEKKVRVEVIQNV